MTATKEVKKNGSENTSVVLQLVNSHPRSA